MAVFNGVFPILPGKLEAERAFAEETMGARRADFEEFQKRRGVTRESWSVQQAPDGNAFAVIWFASPDAERAIVEVARDPSEFAACFREQVKELSGIEFDPAQPLQSSSSTGGPEHPIFTLIQTPNPECTSACVSGPRQSRVSSLLSDGP
jgi:hypothetical protein